MRETTTKPVSLRRLVRLFWRISGGLALLILLWSCGTVPGLQEESTGSLIRLPFVRVLLDERADGVTVGADASFGIECLKAGQQQVFYSGQPVTVRTVDTRLVVYNYKNEVIRDSLDEVNILPRGNRNRVHYNQKRFRGIFRMLPRGEAVRVINIVYMEDYLRGVVPPEIGKRVEGEVEAVKAQAVAARTYAMAHLKQYDNEPYDIKSSIMDQLYDGVTVEDPVVNEAVDKTAGCVVMYHDQLIDAYYHSTCGGRTDDINQVWERQEVPYLKSVDDGTACSWSKYYTWKEDFTEEQLRGRVEHYLTSDRGRDFRIGRITDVFVGDRTPGGRVKSLVVQTLDQIYRFQKDRIRWVIGRTSNPDLILPSDNFEIDLHKDAAGQITSITFRGRGYGHGVGMCQCGAIGHARDGWTYEQILTHYYTNTNLKTLY